MEHRNAEETLKLIMTPGLEHLFVKSIRNSYLAIDRLYHDPDYEILQGKIAKEVIPYLKRAAITNLMKKYATESELNIVISEEPNVTKNCHHVELEDKLCRITLNHTSKKKQLPRKAVFRDNHMYDSQLRFETLFDNVQLLREPKTYIMVTHGGVEQLEYINIGIPDGDGKSWEYSYLVDLNMASEEVDKDEQQVIEEILVSLLEEENTID